jgi:nocturnin
LNKRLLDRQWQADTPAKQDQITVLQWNCLADWASSAFPRVDPTHLQWEYRKPLIIEEILRAEPDIVCLQEVDHYDELKSLLASKYAGHFKSKGIDPGTPGRDGGAIFWKRDRLTFRENIDQHYASMCNVAEMKQVMMSVAFDFKLTTEQVASVRIVATHLKAKTGFDEQRRLQCEAIAQFLNAEGTPLDLTIVCGDFNTERQSDAVTGLLQHANSVALESAYHRVNEANSGEGREPEWTTWKIRDKVKKTTIDFIFYDGRSAWQPVDVWRIPDERDIDDTAALPCATYPSDHLALAAKFELQS